MGKFLPVTIAFVLRCCNVMLFREAFEMIHEKSSTYVFIFDIYLLLLGMRLYPKSFRSLGRFFNCIMEFFIATFIIENLVADFWEHVNSAIFLSLELLATYLEEAMEGNSTVSTICDILRQDVTAQIPCFALVFFFLIAVLHAVGAIDLGELECGIKAFFSNTILRLKKHFKKRMRQVGFGGKRVHLRGVRSRSSRRGMGKRSSNPCCHRSEDYCDYDYGDVPMDKQYYDSELRTSFSDFEMSLRDD